MRTLKISCTGYILTQAKDSLFVQITAPNGKITKMIGKLTKDNGLLFILNSAKPLEN